MERKSIHKKWKVEVKSEQNGVVPVLGNGQESSVLQFSKPRSRNSPWPCDGLAEWKFRTVKAATESITIELRNIVGSTAISE